MASAPAYGAALLVDGHHERHAPLVDGHRLQTVDQPSGLRRALNVAGKEDDAPTLCSPMSVRASMPGSKPSIPVITICPTFSRRLMEAISSSIDWIWARPILSPPAVW